MINQQKIDEVVSRITKRFDPEKIILFGSHASQNQTSDSDLDLLIVKETKLPVHQRSNEIRYHLLGLKIPMDILVYTSDEFDKEKNVRFSFLNGALKNSIVLYERTN